MLQNSVFCYVLRGILPAGGEGNIHGEFITDNLWLERVIRKFLEIEKTQKEFEISKTREGYFCDKHFLKNHFRIRKSTIHGENTTK